MAKPRHTQEFKNESVKLALEKDANRKQIADNLGINYKTLCGWIAQSMSDQTPEKIDYKTCYQQLIAENAQLKRKLKQAETEREILKKAAAYFANHNT
jgi:transposase